MFKQIFRLTFVTFIWKRYKRAIVSTALLLFFFWMVNFAHSEFLAFAEHSSNSEHISLSFMIKWLSLVLGVIIYLVYSFWLPINETDEKSLKLNKKDQKEKFIEVDPNAPDPFDAIRKKDKLRSRAEMMIEKKSSSNSNSNT